MGYESKLYIVKKTSLPDPDGMYYSQVLAMFDMCKVYPLVPVFNKKTDCYFYADDGNTKVLEDCYGDPIKEASLGAVIKFIEHDIAQNGEYRRYTPLLAALKAYKEQQDTGIWDGSLAVLHYGY